MRWGREYTQPSFGEREARRGGWKTNNRKNLTTRVQWNIIQQPHNNEKGRGVKKKLEDQRKGLSQQTTKKKTQGWEQVGGRAKLNTVKTHLVLPDSTKKA